MRQKFKGVCYPPATKSILLGPYVILIDDTFLVFGSVYAGLFSMPLLLTLQTQFEREAPFGDNSFVVQKKGVSERNWENYNVRGVCAYFEATPLFRKTRSVG